MSFGFEIPNFSLVRELGAGGPAPVFLADQEGLERQAAVRILRRNRSALGPDPGPDLVQPFERESRLLARVQHRNIVRIYQIGATDAVLFRAMEYLEGGSLLDRMRANELTPVHAVNCCAQLAQALHAVHALDAFHHDLRPSCILFRDARTPVLADLGLVRASTLDSSATATGVSQRTPRYLSPEQLQGQPADARSNVFALGLLFHLMLTGEFPGQRLDPAASDMSRIAEQLEPLPAEVAVLLPVLARMLAGIPEQRYPDMLEVHAALAAAMPLEGELTAASFHVPAPGPLRRKSLRVLALAGVPVILAAAFAAWHWLPRGLDEAELRQVEQELREFDTYMARMDIYGPSETNATASLEKLLAITRERPEVREAAQRLAEIYLQDAYNSHLRKNFEDALRLTSKGLEFAPGNLQLGQLQLEADKALAALKLQKLLARGESALAQQNLLPPMPGNAFSIFMEVKSLDPGNQAADSRLREIQLRIAEQARTAWAAQGPDRAQAIATEGLQLFPGSVLLNDLLTDLEHAQPAN
jgi:serine/threonine protein kinase